MDPNTPINDYWTVGDFESEFEGSEYRPATDSKDHFFCDFCSVGIAYEAEPRLAYYVADKVLNPEHPVWRNRPYSYAIVPLAVYCEDCSHRRIFFPCEGFGEVRAFFDLTEDRTMENVEVTDVSPPDDGIPWSPKELSERITGVSWEEHMLMQMVTDEAHLWGPENMITFFLSAVNGVDPRELIQYDGTLDPKALGRARKSWKEFTENMRQGDYERTKFRDHVRGGNDAD